MTNDERRANELSQLMGASSWLTSLPLEFEQYVLNKREFLNAIYILYHWESKRLPTTCVCVKAFNINYAMSCLK